jgi:TRAP-type C4-dicarboxylate transport system permease small subunit
MRRESMEKLYFRLVDILTKIAGIFVALIFVAVFSESISRNLFSHSLTANFEISVFLMIVAAFLGSAAAFGRNAHFVIFNLARRLPKRLAAAVVLFVDIITVSFLGLLGYYGMILAIQEMNQLSAALKFPIGILYLSLPIFSVFSILLIGLRYLLPKDVRLKLATSLEAAE